MCRLRQGRTNTARGCRSLHCVRRWDQVRHAGATGPLTLRADSGFYTACAMVAACRKLDVRFSITIRQHQSVRNIIEAIPEAGLRRPIPYWTGGRRRRGRDHVCPLREQARRRTGAAHRPEGQAPRHGSQLALFTSYSYHPFITDRAGQTLDLEADHRRHAEIENAIRDLKYGVGLNHLPSGRFPANGAWLAVHRDGPQPGTLDNTHRPGRDGSNHQDPATTLLLPGRTPHPQGPPPHPASDPHSSPWQNRVTAPP